MSAVEQFDVVVIGYGPVGQVQAALLAARGWTVGVFERHLGLYGLPRAGHIDHEIVRILQSVGIADEFTGRTVTLDSCPWLNHDRDVLMTFVSPDVTVSGWPSDLMMFQPDLEQALDTAVRRWDGASINFGWEAVGLTEADGAIEIQFAQRSEDGQAPGARTVRARYVIAADGANSFVRESCGIEFDDIDGFREQWLVADLELPREQSVIVEGGVSAASIQICDPSRPMMTAMLGRKHQRFEFMRMPHDTDAQLADPEFVWSLIEPWIPRDEARLIRTVVYEFRSMLARHWRRGRVLLAGDAAHLMPPFMGQGMCSGLRDAAGLAWRLDLVLSGRAGDGLLDSYEAERSPHARTWIDLSAFVGRISCTTDPEQAAARDAALLAGHAPPPPPPPGLVSGTLQGGTDLLVPVGALGVQGRVRVAERTGRADDILGHARWQLVCRRDPRPILSPSATDLLHGLDVAWLALDDPDIEDLDGTYARWLDEHGIGAALVRPDFYVFGVAATIADVEALAGELAVRLDWRPVGPALDPAEPAR